MDLDAVAVFVKVVEAKSFSEAARRLNMPKTTVSAKVAALERQLGITLIQRTTRRLHITESGQNFFRRCAVGLKEIELGEAELLAEVTAPKGILRVTAPVDLGRSVLPSIVGEYLKLYPETEVDLLITNHVVDLLGEGVDLALRAGELKDSTLRARKFIDFQLGFWATPTYLNNQKYFFADRSAIQNPRDLQNLDFITHTSFPQVRKIMQFEEKNGAVAWRPKTRIRVDDFETLLGLVKKNLGVGLLPDFMVQNEVKSGAVKAVLPKWWKEDLRTVYFVYPGQKYASTKVRAFMEVAIRQIKIS